MKVALLFHDKTEIQYTPIPHLQTLVPQVPTYTCMCVCVCVCVCGDVFVGDWGSRRNFSNWNWGSQNNWGAPQFQFLNDGEFQPQFRPYNRKILVITYSE